MKIEFRKPAGAGAYTVLADEGDATAGGLGARISQYQPQLGVSPDTEKMYSQVLFTQDRGNGQWTLSFLVDRIHASADAAAAYLATHPAAFYTAGQNFDLKITVGAQVVYLANCALTKFEPDPHSDQSTKVRYAFTGGSYTTTAP